MRWVVALGMVVVSGCVCVAAADVKTEAEKGQALLEQNCGRCHGVVGDQKSPLKQAPNLSVVLGAWPNEELEMELADGVGSRHRDMPQIQFSPEEITSIYYFLHGGEEKAPAKTP
ncbi:cytochrome c [Hyphomicrobium sp. NDB2Meth4]|uniref:c-type cytochrome n=1 Tax=Hyphomicrobium sp. NDB2Meth4 TaxID=1892846 RepID=UPI0009301D03|nr:cytochrome c [Hyphomicrobium sp. NDB2Meth4]